MNNLDDFLKHHGVKGMKWGVIRNRNRPGGADGVKESKKVDTPEGRVVKKGKIRQKIDSLKRERDWNKVLKNMDALTTKELGQVKKRVDLENNLKDLSKSKIAQKKDKQDYLRRDKMSDEELNRKVSRLRAKDNLYKSVKKASKEQREFGQKVVQTGGSISLNYALTKQKPGIKDVFKAARDPKGSYNSSKKEYLKTIPNSIRKDILETVLDKIASSDDKKG
jgi:hypothetical protein